MTFYDLGLCDPILHALDQLGYEDPSPIQTQAIPPALAGRDVLGCAQTGTGKTCAFAAPMLQRLSQTQGRSGVIRGLILTPTRELAIQIGERMEEYGKHLSLTSMVLYGGVSQVPQVAQLNKGVDILVATPGRLADLHQQGLLSLKEVEILVLDEADRMLDMGFIQEVQRIIGWLPKKKQTLFFSATMPKEIMDLVDTLLQNPVRVAVDPISSPVQQIAQSVYFVDRSKKTKLLALLVDQLKVKQALVFTRTKHGANRVAQDLNRWGIASAAIHGNKSQGARQQALQALKGGTVRCLVATDIAARGLDVEELSHVFNYNLPEVPETYIHRIGRTGRAGRQGVAVALCDPSEKTLLQEIEKLMGISVSVVKTDPLSSNGAKETGAEGISGSEGTREGQRRPGLKRRGGMPRNSGAAASGETGRKVVRPSDSRGEGTRATRRARPPQGGTVDSGREGRRRPASGEGHPARGVQRGEDRGAHLNQTPEGGGSSPGAVAHQRRSAPSRTRGTQRGRRDGLPRPPREPRRSGQTKDSTEQRSLMKPYYLDH